MTTETALTRAVVVEATAPARIDLAGATLDIWPLYLFHPGAVGVSVAIDRRAWCRVEAGVKGIRIESKDTLLKVEGKDVAEVLATGHFALVGHILRALGIETGLRVVTQSKVPEHGGLGGVEALAVATAAAAARLVGRALDAHGLCAVVRDSLAQTAGAPAGVQDLWAAVRGGVLGLALEPGTVRAEHLATDPGRIEESLLLVDSGETGPPGVDGWEVLKAQIDGVGCVRGALASIADLARRIREALVAHRYDAIGELISEEWESRKRLAPTVTTRTIDRVVEVVRSAGGAAKACGAGGGGMVAVWATPGSRGPGTRERVEEAVRAAGFRPLKFRVDLRGLEVE